MVKDISILIGHSCKSWYRIVKCLDFLQCCMLVLQNPFPWCVYTKNIGGDVDNPIADNFNEISRICTHWKTSGLRGNTIFMFGPASRPLQNLRCIVIWMYFDIRKVGFWKWICFNILVLLLIIDFFFKVQRIQRVKFTNNAEGPTRLNRPMIPILHMRRHQVHLEDNGQILKKKDRSVEEKCKEKSYFLKKSNIPIACLLFAHTNCVLLSKYFRVGRSLLIKLVLPDK